MTWLLTLEELDKLIVDNHGAASGEPAKQQVTCLDSISWSQRRTAAADFMHSQTLRLGGRIRQQLLIDCDAPK